MEVFILFHDTDIIGAYFDPAKAIKCHETYIDALEAAWRETEEPSKNNTFNRFGDYSQTMLAAATLDRANDHHTVFVLRIDVEY